MTARDHLGIAGLEDYLFELGAEVRVPASPAFTVGPATGFAPPSFRLSAETYKRMEDQRMWTLDATWAATAVFEDRTVCVRISDFGAGYRVEPYVNPDEIVEGARRSNPSGCRNWAGSPVPPSCSWAYWKVAGCDQRTLLDSMFQFQRYQWAQRRMAEMLASKPTERQFGPALGDALAAWVVDAYALTSALLWSTNIRFDDQGGYDWPKDYAKKLIEEGVLAPGLPPGRQGTPTSRGLVQLQVYNDMSTQERSFAERSTPKIETSVVRRVPLSKRDFEPVVELPSMPSSRGTETHPFNRLNAERASATVKLRAWAKYDFAGFSNYATLAENWLRHYSSVPFSRWQQVAVARWVSSIDALLPLVPAEAARLAALKQNAQQALSALAAVPEAAARAEADAMAGQASQGGTAYQGLLVGVTSAINSVAGTVLAIAQVVINALTGWIVQAAGAATGRPMLCPAIPYLRVFAQPDCTVDVEVELRRIEQSSEGSCPSGTTGTPPNCAPIPGLRCPAGATGTPPNCTPVPVAKGGGGLVIGAAALLLLSRFLR